MTETLFSEEGLQAGLRNIVDLATEELFVNMVTYNTESDADILIQMNPHEHGVEVSLTDYDVERFDPTGVGPIDVNVPLEWSVIGLVFCSAVGIVFGLLPAVRASRLSPVDALRYE